MSVKVFEFGLDGNVGEGRTVEVSASNVLEFIVQAYCSGFSVQLTRSCEYCRRAMFL